MQESEREELYTLVSNVQAFYKKPISTFSLSVWWEATKPFDLEAVKDAFNRHCVNPDNGQFAPMPADVVKLLHGSTKDGALVAWSKVDLAVRQVGPYQTVAFDDPIIHAVIQDMGGWVAIGAKDGKEWPFVRNEFENRYRGYRLRNDATEYPCTMIGIAEAQNGREGFDTPPPVLIGDPRRAQVVIARGADRRGLGFTRMDPATAAQLLPNRQAL